MLPSFAKICTYIFYDDELDQIDTNKLSNSSKILFALLNPERLLQYGAINKNLNSLEKFENNKYLPLTKPVFVHMTNDAYSILNMNELNTPYFSASLFDPSPNKTGLYSAFPSDCNVPRLGIILSIYPISIIAAHHFDFYSPAESLPPKFAKIFLNRFLQNRVIYAYISRIFHQSKYYNEMKEERKSLNVFKYRSNTCIRRLEQMINCYQKAQLTEEEEKSEFKKIFGRDGFRIVKELKNINVRVRCDILEGKMDSPDRLTQQTKIPSRCNEVFAFTHKSVNSQQHTYSIKGILITPPTNVDAFEYWRNYPNKEAIENLVKQRCLSIYYSPREPFLTSETQNPILQKLMKLNT